MDATEFRLFNYVAKGMVTNLMDGYVYVNKERFVEKDVNPMPLTEGFLMCWGWIRINEDTLYVVGADITFKYECELGRLSIEIGEEEGMYLDHIKHMHQLQNLYFSLTGEELTIK